MAKYGAKYLQWAPFVKESADTADDAYPKYGDPMNLGALVKVTDTPSFNEAKIYGDNKGICSSDSSRHGFAHLV